jgi:signal transduction histidine kinase
VVGAGGDAGRRVDTLDAVLIVVVLGLTASTVAAVLAPDLVVSAPAVGLDLLLDVVAALVTVSVTVLAWIRYREGGDPTALVQAGAFLVLSIANVITVVLTLLAIDAPGSIGVLLPGQAPLYVTSAADMQAASLLAVGVWAALRGAPAGHPWATLAAPVVGLIGITVLVHVYATNLPILNTAFATRDGAAPAGAPISLQASTPLGWLVALSTAVLFLVAALESRRLHRRDGSIGQAYLSLGLVFAGASQIHLAMSSGSYPGLVSEGDLLRVGFDVALLLGIEAEARATLASLRTANRTLVRLKEAESARSVLQERARLARELHDGLSQDLWLAKLKVGRLTGLPSLGDEGTALVQDLAGAVDAGLANARQAVIALRWTADAEVSFRDQLARYVDDFADRCGLVVEFTCEREIPRLAPRTEAELLRIAQEALNNVYHHADATVIRVHASADDGSFRMVVLDNGRGFDAAQVGDSAYGLASMRERAGIIGGRLTIDSQPRDGTRVTIDVPVAAAGVS